MVTALALTVHARTQASCDGVTFADSPSKLWVPIANLPDAWKGEVNTNSGTILLNNTSIRMRRLYGTDGWVVRLTDLAISGLTISWNHEQKSATVSSRDSQLRVIVAPKFVRINLSQQQLTAYQGATVVLKTNISSGRNNWTPRGDFISGLKERIHYSSLFNHVSMPSSVQVDGNIFIHAYPQVPAYPASHGCIRLPLLAAEALYNWIECGTPIQIS